MTQSAGDAADRMLYGRGGRSDGFIGGIKENPIPAALIGVGAAWWYMSSRSTSRREGGYRYGAPYTPAGSRLERHPGEAQYRAGAADRGEFSDYDNEYGVEPWHGYTDAAGSSRSSSERTGLVDRLKDNPVPAALAGLGLAWLAMAGRPEPETDAHSYERGRMWRSGEGEESSSMTGSVAKAASDAAESAREMTSGAQEYTQQAARRMRYKGRRAQTELERLSRENPLAVGAGALLLGAAVALVLPETERENEWMGEARDSMVDRAQEMATNAASTAQDAAADLAGEAASRVVKGAKE